MFGKCSSDYDVIRPEGLCFVTAQNETMQIVWHSLLSSNHHLDHKLVKSTVSSALPYQLVALVTESIVVAAAVCVLGDFFGSVQWQESRTIQEQ